jgi:hypothetical protein
MKNLRYGLTGEAFGLYFKVTCLQHGIVHELQLYADKFTVDAGMLLLYRGELPYRAFAPGQWLEISSISIMDGSEMWEDADYVREEDYEKL